MKRVSQIGSGKKVFVGMSGGVDSSVSAAILKKDGYNVTGVFIKVWQPDWIECNWREDRRDAMRVAARLGIPFLTLDLEREYKKEVIDYMIKEYSQGRTPNPDVMCNKHVKFGAFYDWAIRNGADYVATGHYVRTRQGHSKTYSLLAGTDPNKDQSYFLWNIKQEQLAHILFPIGHLNKTEVRKLAKDFDLPNAEKKDSQGLCFIGKIDIKEFLSHYIESKPGKALNTAGEEVGHHSGALFLTIGERRGFTITKKTPNDAPYYIIAKNISKNEVVVSNRVQDHKDSGKSSLPGAVTRVEIRDVNWISGIPVTGKNVQVRSRYRQQLQNAKIENIDLGASKATIEFIGLQNTISPGQSLVIYDGEECLGGGVIR